MSERLPLFPLGTVLLPGLLLPLQIFEDRYRQMVRELMALPPGEARAFGVVAIRHGREIGKERPTIYDVGCTAVVRRSEPRPDGRLSLVAVGGTRFRVVSVDAGSQPYLVGQVDYLDDPVGDAGDAATLVPAVTRLLHIYADRLSAAKAIQITLPDLPESPRILSYLVAASLATDTSERQALLAAPDAARRLRAERALLQRELALLDRMTSIPSNELTKTIPCPN